MLGNYLQQTTSADNIFGCIFFGALRVKWCFAGGSMMAQHWILYFVIFQGTRTSIAKKPYSFVIFHGGIPSPCTSPPPLDPLMMSCSVSCWILTEQDNTGCHPHFLIKLSPNQQYVTNHNRKDITDSMLGNLSWFLLSADIFQHYSFSKHSFKNNIRLSKSLDPDLAWHSDGTDLGPNFLQSYQQTIKFAPKSLFYKARIFFISWFTGFFFFADLGLGGGGTEKKALKMTSWLVIFRAFFFDWSLIVRCCFFNTNSKTNSLHMTLAFGRTLNTIKHIFRTRFKEW